MAVYLYSPLVTSILSYIKCQSSRRAGFEWLQMYYTPGNASCIYTNSNHTLSISVSYLFLIIIELQLSTFK